MGFYILEITSWMSLIETTSTIQDTQRARRTAVLLLSKIDLEPGTFGSEVRILIPL